jgi:hypothetical protein
MPSISLEKEFKDAIKALPEKRKSTILLRLLKKEPLLVDQLTYELIEDPIEGKEDRVAQIDDLLEEIIGEGSSDGVGEIKYNLKNYSGRCTWFQKVVKDDYLALKLLVEGFTKILSLNFFETKRNRYFVTDAFVNYVQLRTRTIVRNHAKLHPDQQFDLIEPINKLLLMNRQIPDYKYGNYINDLPEKIEF